MPKVGSFCMLCSLHSVCMCTSQLRYVDAVQAEKENKFSQLTDAAGELMNLGFEDIYQDTKQKIADGLDE